jgi:hypothetical protein
MGALAGSTVLLLTMPWVQYSVHYALYSRILIHYLVSLQVLAVYSGRVNISPTTGEANYAARPKVSRLQV